MFLAAVGILAGLLSGLVGIGGGIAILPALAARGVPVREAAAVSLVFAAVTSFSAAGQHLRAGLIHRQIAGWLIAGALPAALAGSWLSGITPDRWLRLAFGAVVLPGAAIFGWKATGAARPGLRQLSGTVALATGVGVGLISGMFGIGGGWLLVPALLITQPLKAAEAVATSAPAILVPALAGVWAHWRLGHLDLLSFWPLIVCGIAGARVGARLAGHVPDIWLLRILRIVLVIAAAAMLL